MKIIKERLMILLGNVQGHSYRQIARDQGCDRRTVKRYIENPELAVKKRQSAPRTSLLDAFREMVKSFLDDEEGNHRASWIYDQLVKCGYTGGYEIVKRMVRQIKGSKQQLAYVRFETAPGEQAQVDFGEFNVTLVDGTVNKYFLFAMILGYSRKMYACLLDRCDLPSFLEAHIRAFEHLGGVPQEILYDRMRNVYVRRLCETPDAGSEALGVGKPLFTQALMTLAVHYGFKPSVAPAYCRRSW